jgi:adenosylcobinamide kinase/adenosylcobinamide-phosphate guanylyltransferase
MGEIVFVLGGARSGKSDLAERLAAAQGGRVLFVATMSPGDAELRERVTRHRARRPPWDVLEEPLDITERLERIAGRYDTVALDCLTLWVSNLLLAGRAPERAVQDLLDRGAAWRARLIIVSNEVGSGVVPPSALGRAFRDELGHVNRLVAARSSAVYYLVAGMPVDLKPPSSPLRLETAPDDPRR